MLAGPAFAQVTELPPVIPGQSNTPVSSGAPASSASPSTVSPSAVVASSAPAPAGVTADPYRVYGDDAPVFAALGAVAGELGFHIGGSLVTEYSDNVARSSGEFTPSWRYRSKGDWIFRPEVGVNMARQFGRQRLFFSGSVGRNIYARNSALDSHRFSLGGGATLALGTRCGGGLQGGYSNRGTQLGTFEEVFPSTQERISLSASASCRTPGGLSASLGYNHGQSRNHTDDPLGEVDRSFANVTSNSLNGSLGYAVGVRGQLGVQGFTSTNRFPNQLLATGGSNENRVLGASLFAAYRVGNSLSASGSVGKTEVRTNSAGAQTFSGGTWNVSLNYAGPRIGANMSAGRSVNAGAGGSANYSIGTFFNGTTTYRVNDRMSGAAGFSLSSADYRGFDSLPETQALRSAKTRRYFVGGNYRMNRILAFSVDLNHQRRSSVPSGFNYNVNTFILGIRARF